MILTDNNFITYSAMNYINYNCENDEEFLEDLNRIQYIKKLFTKYHNKNELNTNLILNHIIVLYNTFDSKACTKMLFLKLPDYWHYLKTVLHFTGYLPDYVSNLIEDGFIIETGALPFDKALYDEMRAIIEEKRK
jgi:hypothetical protein